uniref:PcfJ-like protein n=1 Tax=Steinernema glaseri TaxID=37863 RepID=A0A1I7XYM6_9BILA
MDSVPIRFWEGVFFALRWNRWRWYEIAEKLPQPWKTLAWRHATRRLDFYINFPNEPGEWSCWIETYDDQSLLPKSLKELLAMDPRYLRCDEICVGMDRCMGTALELCRGKENITEKVIPFLCRAAFIKTGLEFEYSCPREKARFYMDIFRNMIIFSRLGLPYFGQETEDFLATQVANNYLLWNLAVQQDWPVTEANEDLVVQYLTRKKGDLEPQRALHLYESLKTNFRILKAAFDTWYQSENEEVHVYSVAGHLTMEEVLSLPVPEDVWRVEGVYVDNGEYGDVYGDRLISFIRWTKPNGACFRCDYHPNDHFPLVGTTKRKGEYQWSVERGLPDPRTLPQVDWLHFSDYYTPLESENSDYSSEDS